MRRYAPMKASRGTVIPANVRAIVNARDGWCVAARAGMPDDCSGSLELDHVRASHGMGMKSPTTPENLVLLCAKHHLERTLHGKKWRPVLLEYLNDATRSLSTTAQTAGSSSDPDPAAR